MAILPILRHSSLHTAALAAQKRSLSSGSSTLMERQGGPIGPFYNGDVIPAKTQSMDCDPKSKSDSKSTSKDDSNNNNNNNNNNKNAPLPVQYGTMLSSPSVTTSSALPVISRRRLRTPMRRDNKPSIFERDEPLTTRASEPITVRDILAYYLKRRAAKRAMKPRTSRGGN